MIRNKHIERMHGLQNLIAILFIGLLSVRTVSAMVRIGSDVFVDDYEKVENVVVISGNATIDGEVEENVVVVRGDIIISGRVGENVTSVMGDIILNPGARVLGDVTSVGGGIDYASESYIGGKINEVGIETLPHKMLWKPVLPKGRLFRFLVICIISILIVLFFPRGTVRLKETAVSHFWQCFGFGILGGICIVPAIFFLIISIFGIPLVPLVILGAIAAYLFGLAGISLTVGTVFIKRTNIKKLHPILTVLIGLVLLYLLPFLGSFSYPGNWTTRLVGVCILLFAWSTGLGSVILTKFGVKDYAK